LRRAQALLKGNPDVVFSADKGATALHLAAGLGHEEVTELLR
jgi:ankyrin repeat protein